VTEIYPLAQVDEALAYARTAAAGKVLLAVEPEADGT
jgi:hypothetical protein